ncbi:hypothetical protein [Amaricoccus sp.]|uniref:hypothetical protein n=1 Tax=Amaricoccus sp. TaxID=1872485 RepID=UPI001B48DFDE|nr:hypothetical protein [Amaricoccus sp.]MBP7242933.1 hypothetical protein [Amaricoccus sp.]
MTQVVKLRLDLDTRAGRAAMRAWLDATEDTETPARSNPTPAPEGEHDPVRASVNRPSGAGTHEEEGTGSPGRGHCESVAPMAGPDGAEADAGPVPIEEPDAGAVVEAPLEGPVEGPVEDVVAEVVGEAEEAAVGEVLPAGDDPERPWTEELRREVWRRWQDGQRPGVIARALTLRAPRVYMLVADWKRGARRQPEGEKATATALVPVNATAGALALAARRPAQDEGMRARRLEEMAQAERDKFVARSLVEDPETQP